MLVTPLTPPRLFLTEEPGAVPSPAPVRAEPVKPESTVVADTPQVGCSPDLTAGKGESQADKEAHTKNGTVTLRKHQQEAVRAVLGEFGRKIESTLIVHPTGSGKTYVAASIASFAAQKNHGVLWLAHREELIDQAVNSLKKVGLHPLVEKGQSRARPDFVSGISNVVVASVQSMKEDRLGLWDPSDFRLIICDEAHHSTSKSYRRIFDYFVGSRIMGMTATADRLDGANLGRVYETKAHEYNLRQAVRDEMLVPLKVNRLNVDPPIDLRDLKVVGSGDKADFAMGALDQRVTDSAEILISAIMKDRWSPDGLGNHPAILFAPDIHSAETMAACFRSSGVTAEGISHKTKNRRDKVRSFRKGRFQVFCNSMLFTEGTDFPFVSRIILCRPTMSRGLVMQMLGRGMRLPDDNPLSAGKVECVALDFAWLLDKHKLVHPVQLYDDSSIDREVMQRAQKIMEDRGERDIEAALEAAEKEQAVVVAQRVRLQQRQVQVRKISYDPLGTMEVLGLPKMQTNTMAQFDPPPEWMIEKLKKHRVDNPHEMSFEQARKVYTALQGRLVKGLATVRQVGYLMALGVPAAEAREMKFKAACEEITRRKEIKAQGGIL